MPDDGLRNQSIGYFVIVPKYVVEQRIYPMRLEQYEQGPERSSAYVMDKALGMLKSDFRSLTQEKLKCDRFEEIQPLCRSVVQHPPPSEGNRMGLF